MTWGFAKKCIRHFWTLAKIEINRKMSRDIVNYRSMKWEPLPLVQAYGYVRVFYEVRA